MCKSRLWNFGPADQLAAGYKMLLGIIGREELLVELDDLEGSGLGIKGVCDAPGMGFELSPDKKKWMSSEQLEDWIFRALDSSISTVKPYLTFIFTQLEM